MKHLSQSVTADKESPSKKKQTSSEYVNNNMNLSSNEAAFFVLNREYRGIAANSEKAKHMIRIT